MTKIRVLRVIEYVFEDIPFGPTAAERYLDDKPRWTMSHVWPGCTMSSSIVREETVDG